MSEAGIFRKHQDLHELATKFPVTVKSSSKIRAGEKGSSFVSIMAQKLPEPTNPNDLVLLRQKQNVDWRNLICRLLAITDTSAWRMTILLTIAVHFSLVTFQYCFKRSPNSMMEGMFILSLDLSFLTDYLLALVIYCWKYAQLRLVHRPRSRKCIIADTILVLPYSIIYRKITGDNYSWMFMGLRCISIGRLYQIEMFFKNKANTAGVNHRKFFILRYITWLLLLMHTFCCIWFVRAMPFASKTISGWGNSAQLYSLHLSTSNEWYLGTMYFILSLMTNAGFGDIHVTNDFEKVMACIVIWVGFTITTGVFIGSLATFFVNVSQRKANLWHQVRCIKGHLLSINMDKRISQNIIDYYELLWMNNKGVREAAAIKLLPLPLRMEICFDVNFSLLRCSLIFRNKPEWFLRTVSLMMKYEFYLAGDTIYYQHVVKYKMIFVASGVIDILSDEDDQSPIISFGPGTCLGEAALIMTLPARATVRAAKYTELQVLYKKDFFTTMDSYPIIYSKIRSEIFDRIEDGITEHRKAGAVEDEVTLSVFASHKTNNSAIRKLKNRLDPRRAHLVHPNEQFYYKALSLYHLSGNNRKERSKFLFRTSSFPWILQPDTNLRWTWEVIIVISALFVTLTYPYYVVYDRKFPAWLDLICPIFEALLLFDIYVILTTAVIQKDRVIEKVKDILFYRLGTVGFYLDVLATFYIEVFAYLLEDGNRMYYILKLNRILKIYRVSKYFDHLEEHLTTNVFAVRLVKYPIYITLCTFLYGAVLYMQTCYTPVCRKNGWYQLKKVEELKNKQNSGCSEAPMIVSMYFALNVLSTLGYGDIVPGTLEGLILVCLGLVLGILIFGYCIAEFSALFVHYLKSKTEFQEVFFTLMNFLSVNRINKEIKTRVLNFFVLQWEYNKGFNITSNHSLYYNATEKTQRDVMVKERTESIMKIPLFHGVDMDFIQVIAAQSSIRVLPPREMVVHSGEAINEMYIVCKGFCNQQIGTTQYRIIGPGTHFGLLSLLHGVPSYSAVTTLTHVQIISISSETFKSALSLFPHIADEINAAKQDEDIEKLMKTAIRYAGRTDFVKLEHKFWKHAGHLNVFSGSFINVRKHCERTGEDYNGVFKRLGRMSWIRYFLLPYCILPNKKFIKHWVVWRSICAIAIALITPYQLLQAPYIPALDPVVVVLDLIAYVDLYIMMLVGFYGQRNQLVIHPCKTAAHYLKGTFLIDFVLCFPWEILLKLLFPNHNEGHSARGDSYSPHVLHCILRLNRVLQVYRLPRGFQFLKDDIQKKAHVLEVLKFIPFTVVIIFMWAGILVKFSCVPIDVKELRANFSTRMEIKVPGRSTHRLIEKTMICDINSWLDHSRYDFYGQGITVFNVAIYWVTSTIIGAGFGDVTPHHWPFLVITMVMIMTGVLYFGYAYASISSSKACSNTNLLSYQQKVKELKSFMETEHVSLQVRHNLLSYFEYQWKRARGTEPNYVLSKLHPALYEDAVLDMYERALREVPLFENVDRSFFRILGKELREKYFKKDHVITQANNIMENIYIIYRGRVEVMSCYNEMQAFMGVGGLFGNITLQSKAKVSVTITASRNVDLLFVKTDVFHSIVEKYPSVKKKVHAMLSEDKDFLMPTTLIDSNEDLAEPLESVSTLSSISKQDVYSRCSSSTTGTSTTGASTIGASTIGASTLASVNTNFATVTDILLPHKWNKMIFLPDTSLFITYEQISMAAAYLSCLIVTYQFTFQHHTYSLLVLSVALDVVFILKIFLELNRAYINRYGEYVVDKKKIRSTYFKDKKIRTIEFVSNLPICYFAFLLSPFSIDYYFYFSLLRMITLLRYYYIYDYFKMRSNSVMVNHLYLKIIYMIIWITLSLHGTSCIWYFLTCYGGSCDSESWKSMDRKYIPGKPLKSYILCVYFMSNVFTTTTVGDVLPNNSLQMLFITIVMILTKFLIGVFIGDVANVLDSYSAPLVNYEYGILELKDYLRNEGVSDHQITKMWHYVQQLWARSYGKQLPSIISTLSSVNRFALMYEIYGVHICQSYLFNGTGDAFLRQLCGKLHHTIYFPGNYIVQHGDSDQTMYFIHRGEVEILTVHANLTETIYDILGASEMFGLAQGLFYGVPHHFSFRARTNVNIVSLHLSSWQDLLKFFPDARQLIYARAHSVYANV